MFLTNKINWLAEPWGSIRLVLLVGPGHFTRGWWIKFPLWRTFTFEVGRSAARPILHFSLVLPCFWGIFLKAIDNYVNDADSVTWRTLESAATTRPVIGRPMWWRHRTIPTSVIVGSMWYDRTWRDITATTDWLTACLPISGGQHPGASEEPKCWDDSPPDMRHTHQRSCRHHQGTQNLL